MRRLLGAIVSALIMTACAGGTSGPAPSTSSEPSTTTTEPRVVGTFEGPTTGRALSAIEPLRVTLLGDSLLYDAAPGVEANLTSTGVVNVEKVAVPGFNFGRGLSYAVGDKFDWRSVVGPVVAETRPEVIVASFGIIDSYGIAKGLQTPEGFTASLREALDIMTAGDTKVLLLGIPPSLDDAGKPTVKPMNRDANPIMRRLATEYRGKVEFLDTERLLSASGTPVYVVDGQRVRKLDLIHLCPDGAVRYADAIHETLAASWPVPPAAPGWTLGPWRLDARYENPPGACILTHPGLGN